MIISETSSTEIHVINSKDLKYLISLPITEPNNYYTLEDLSFRNLSVNKDEVINLMFGIREVMFIFERIQIDFYLKYQINLNNYLYRLAMLLESPVKQEKNCQN